MKAIRIWRRMTEGSSTSPEASPYWIELAFLPIDVLNRHRHVRQGRCSGHRGRRFIGDETTGSRVPLCPNPTPRHPMSNLSPLRPFALIALVFGFFLSITSLRAQDGVDEYASYWKCSDGQTYGLVADGSKREFYVPSGLSPIFFSGVKKGATYTGTVYVGDQKVAVTGPVTKNDTMITLVAADGRKWVLEFSHK